MSVWDRVFEAGEFTALEPHPDVVRLVPLLKERGARRVLDLGCGAGRHLILLAREGFEVHGVDISERALSIARERLLRLGLEAELKRCSMTSLDYPSEFFDAVVCINVIYHGTRRDVLRALEEIRRVLRRGGLALITFISKRSWKYGLGKELEEGTYVQSEGVEAGIPHHYVDERELREILSGFTVLELRLDEKVVGGRRISHWVVLAERP